MRKLRAIDDAYAHNPCAYYTALFCQHAAACARARAMRDIPFYRDALRRMRRARLRAETYDH